MFGFFLQGLLLSFLGAMLPAWGYHLASQYIAAGNYFLCMNLGILAGLRASHWLLGRKGISFLLPLACALACAGVLTMALAAPPSLWWRMVGLFWVGTGAGLLNAGLFHSLSLVFIQNPAATVNVCGVLFGLGCIVTALLVAGTFYVYTVASILLLLAVIPFFYAVVYARTPLPVLPLPEAPSWARTFEDFRNPAAVLFALVLFFQFGNEWALAGWLPVFLMQRLGISPAGALLMLAWYWLALLLGRIVVQAVMPRLRHRHLLAAGSLSALFGCVVLTFTDNRFGACAGILFTAAGFAVTYPITVDLIGGRFPHYHPGFFTGIFGIAFAGALLAPATVGYYANWLGIRVVTGLPLAGTCIVALLLALIWLETRLSGKTA